MKKIYVILVIGLFAFTPHNLFDNTAQGLPFTQDWTTTTLITVNDNWSGVPGIEGYLGQDITTTTGVDPQTLLTVSASPTDLDVIANQANPNTNISGGVGEFDGIANPTIALQGSGTADAPYILIHLNTTTLQNITVSYNLRDIDGSADNAVQPVALQYRVGNTGNFTNVPAGFVADATTGPNLATLVTAVSAVLPGACNNQALVQVRVITANAAGSDEWVGVDDINITGSPLSANSINTGAVSAPPFCVDGTNSAAGTVAYTSTGTYAGETFTAKLSDAAGSFAAPVNIGTTTVTGTDPSGTINITIPAGTPTGAGYKIRIDEASIPVTGSESTAFSILNGVQNVTAPAASVANASSSLSWTNPAGCYDEIMIVAAEAANTGTPTGDGTAYFDDLIYANGTALGNGFVVYKGNTSPQVVTALTNGTPYFYKFFTRLGTTWSAGVEISQTPALVSSATDYFRSVASGSWATLATWESSGDSTAWIPATLVPGALAAHVAIQSPDSVWLDANRTTANLTIMSGAKMNAVTFTMTASARFNLLGTASYYQGGTVSIVPGSGAEQVLASTSTYYYNGVQNGMSSGAYPAYGNFIWEPAATGSGTFQNTVAAAPFNLGLVIRGDMTINLQSVAVQEVRFATGTSITRSHTIDGNLNIISANSKVVVTNGSLPVLSTVTVGGNINISAGILQGTSSFSASDGSAVLKLSGNINNTGGTIQTGASAGGKFSINYVGTGAQSINNTGGFFNFTANQLDSVNKPTGELTLNTPITDTGTIRLISGIVNTTSTNLLTMAPGSAVSNASNASFVNGPVKKMGNTTFEFPIGKTGTGLVPFAVSGFTGTLDPVNDAFTAEYIRTSAYTVGATITDPFINHISACDHWVVNRTSGTPTVDITAYWNSNNPCNGTAYVDDLTKLAIVHYDGANWNSSSVGFSSTTGTIAVGTITWAGVTTFSPFSLGSTTYGANPLPITINFFTGMKQNGNHLLNWKVTCVSSPTANMELERSSDGRKYSGIYTKTATALQCQQPFNYTDAQPAAGVNYYRLKMTDASGKVTYSSVVTLINATRGTDVMNIAPNPIVGGRFSLRVSAAQNGKMDVIVTDMQGRMMQRQSTSLVAGFNQVPVNVSSLAAGSYQVSVMTSEGRASVQRFVIQ